MATGFVQGVSHSPVLRHCQHFVVFVGVAAVLFEEVNAPVRERLGIYALEPLSSNNRRNSER